MRKKLIAGNWKMNCLKAEGIALVQGITDEISKAGTLPFDVLVCPPMSVLGFVCDTPHAGLFIGAQDVAETPKSFGAFTGDVSAEMVADLGADFTLVGHSERRTLHGETNEIVHQKAQNAIAQNLTVVICIGETEQQREAGETLAVVAEQIRGSVPRDATSQNCVIAYEPVWAIGTGKVPTVADVADVHKAIRDELSNLLGAEIANEMRILYGGSVKPSNAKELLAVENVDGALIGGASLNVADFWGIAASQL